jgi:hypothetical protein
MDTATGLARIGTLADRSMFSTRTIKYYEELELSSLGNALQEASGSIEKDVEHFEQILDERNGVLSTHEQRDFSYTRRCQGS